MQSRMFSSSESEYEDDDVVLLSPKQTTSKTTCKTTSKFTSKSTSKFTSKSTTTSAFTNTATNAFTNTATNAFTNTATNTTNTAYSNFCDEIVDTVSQRLQKKKLDPNDKTDYAQLKKDLKKCKEQNKKFQEQIDSQNTLINNLQEQINQLQESCNTSNAIQNEQNKSFYESILTMQQFVQAMRINSMCHLYKRSAFKNQPAEEEANTAIAASMHFFKQEIENENGFHEDTNSEKISKIQDWCHEALYQVQSYEAKKFFKAYPLAGNQPFLYDLPEQEQEQEQGKKQRKRQGKK